MKFRPLILASALALAISPAFAADVPKSYPFKKCIMSGEKLDAHGKPVKVTHAGTDVWLCCKTCAKNFKKEPARWVKMVKDASAKN